MRNYAVLAIEERVPLPTFLKHSSSRTRLRSIGVPSTPTIGRSKLNPHDVSELVLDRLGTLPAQHDDSAPLLSLLAQSRFLCLTVLREFEAQT